MITVLHRGGPADEYGITWGGVSAMSVKMITTLHRGGTAE